MDQIAFCEYKILLRGDRLESPDDFKYFWRKVRTIAKDSDVKVKSEPEELAFNARRVSFFDTEAFDLYRNAFILRKRVRVQDGFATEHELTFKFRHPELAKARAVEVRAADPTGSVVKFKEEVLQPRDQSPGSRSIYSHNHVRRAEKVEISPNFGELVASFPALTALNASHEAPIIRVADKIVEEIETDTGRLSFGGDYTAKSSLAVWRDKANDSPLIGEFSFQTRFENYEAIDPAAKQRSHKFYKRLQSELPDWLSAGSTKTALIYGGSVGHE